MRKTEKQIAVEKARLFRMLKKEMPNEWDKEINIDDYYDSTLTYQENFNLILEKIKQVKQNNGIISEKQEAEPITRTEIKAGEQQDKYMQETLLRQISDEAEREFHKSIETILKEPESNIIKEFYKIPEHYTRMVCRGNSNGFVFVSDKGGCGKTYLCLKVLSEEKKRFIFKNGHISEMELYELLYFAKDCILLIDDEGIFNSKTKINMIKSAMWSATGTRILTWTSKSPLLKCPNQFIYEGQLVILLNSIPKDDDFKALLTRILFYDLKISHKEFCMLLAELVKKPYKNLSFEERTEIFRYIQEKTSEATTNISLRLLFQAYEFYLYDKTIWKDLLKNLFQNDEDLTLIKKLIGRGLKMNEALEEFRKETGRNICRKTFYNYRKRFG